MKTSKAKVKPTKQVKPIKVAESSDIIGCSNSPTVTALQSVFI